MQFVCSDTGLGMSEEFQKHAFEPFTCEGKATITGYSGTGLGLSIVNKITVRNIAQGFTTNKLYIVFIGTCFNDGYDGIECFN